MVGPVALPMDGVTANKPGDTKSRVQPAKGAVGVDAELPSNGVFERVAGSTVGSDVLPKDTFTERGPEPEDPMVAFRNTLLKQTF